MRGGDIPFILFRARERCMASVRLMISSGHGGDSGVGVVITRDRGRCGFCISRHDCLIRRDRRLPRRRPFETRLLIRRGGLLLLVSQRFRVTLDARLELER